MIDRLSFWDVTLTYRSVTRFCVCEPTVNAVCEILQTMRRKILLQTTRRSFFGVLHRLTFLWFASILQMWLQIDPCCVQNLQNVSCEDQKLLTQC